MAPTRSIAPISSPPFGLAEAGFQPYSTMHAVVIVSFLLMTGSLVWLRRRWSDSPRAGTFDRVLGIAALIVWLAYRLFVWLPGVRDLQYSLPLQMCDITGFIAPVALLTGRRFFRGMLYFWALGFSILAFIAPDLHEGLGSGRFWLFWLSHFAIVGSALYDVAARGFRPRWRDYWVAIAAAAVYEAVVLPFDVLTHFDYGYVGPPGPGQPPALAALGPWPARLILQAILAGLVLAALQLPWEIFRRFNHDRANRQTPGNIAPSLPDRNASVE